jgi:urea transport system permease protein
MCNPRSASYWLTKNFLRVVLIFLVGFSCGAYADDEPTEHIPADNEAFAELIHNIAKASLNARGELVAQLSQLNHERSNEVIMALQQGNLFNDRALPPNVGISQSDGKFIDAITGEPFSAETSENLRRIPLNNILRTQLRTLLAQMNLNHKDASTREHAVLRMVSDGIEKSTIDVLKKRQAIETNEKVLDAITLALAFYNIQSENISIRKDAVSILSTSLQPEARSTLVNIACNDSDKGVREKATQALADIDSRIGVFRIAENVFFGLSLGSVLLLSAIGLAITFGVMGVINMAHGELMMIGAYTTWVIQQLFPNYIGYSLLMAVPAAFIVAGSVGITIERGVIRFLYGRPLETLLATFGISLILQQAARSIFSPLNRAVISPKWMSGSLVINPIFSITYSRLFIFIFALLVFFVLMMILKKTSLGLKVRAVSQNRAMARAVGVCASWVDAMTFGLGSGVAGIAGVALSQLTNVGSNLGQTYIIESFMVVVFGGVGNLWGTLVSAMGLGILNKFLEPYAGAVLAKILVLVLLILFIQKRPKGIFPQKGRAAAD